MKSALISPNISGNTDRRKAGVVPVRSIETTMTTDPMISDTEVTSYNDKGFIVVENIYTADEVQEMCVC